MTGLCLFVPCDDWSVSVYQHTLPLPLFVPLMPDILHHAQLFSQSETLPLLLPLAVPKLWLILGCNVITQYPLVAGRRITTRWKPYGRLPGREQMVLLIYSYC